MTLVGTCYICSQPAMYTCSLCGKLACTNCYDKARRVCINCRGTIGDSDEKDEDRNSREILF